MLSREIYSLSETAFLVTYIYQHYKRRIRYLCLIPQFRLTSAIMNLTQYW